MIVIDASVVSIALVDDGERGRRARERMLGEVLYAPEVLDLEVLSTWRERARGRKLVAGRARQALTFLYELPLLRAPHRLLTERIWDLRHNLSSYDAAYVALAETLDVPLVTADARLARAPGIRCEVEVLTAP